MALRPGIAVIIIIPSLAPISWNDLKRNESLKTNNSIPPITRLEIWLKDSVKLIPKTAIIPNSNMLAKTILSMLTCKAPILLDQFVNEYKLLTSRMQSQLPLFHRCSSEITHIDDYEIWIVISTT